MDSKVCKSCTEEKVLTEFYRHPTNADRLDRFCKSCRRMQSRQQRLDNPGRAKENARRGRAAWRSRNPGRVQAYAGPEATRRWRAEHPMEARASYARSRVKRKQGTDSGLTGAEIAAWTEETGQYSCVACDGPAEHLDHMQPLKLGGAHELENLQWLCAPCNLSKSAKPYATWLVQLLEGMNYGLAA